MPLQSHPPLQIAKLPESAASTSAETTAAATTLSSLQPFHHAGSQRSSGSPSLASRRNWDVVLIRLLPSPLSTSSTNFRGGGQRATRESAAPLPLKLFYTNAGLFGVIITVLDSKLDDLLWYAMPNLVHLPMA
jgi:hypothetical protein